MKKEHRVTELVKIPVSALNLWSSCAEAQCGSDLGQISKAEKQIQKVKRWK